MEQLWFVTFCIVQWRYAYIVAQAGGSIVGSAFAGLVSDRIGRRDSIAFGKTPSHTTDGSTTESIPACLWWLAGTAVQVSTHSRAQLIVGRVLNGVCVGITSSQVPVYLVRLIWEKARLMNG